MNVFHREIADVLEIDLSKINQKVEFGGVGTKSSSLIGRPYLVNLMVAQKGKSINFDTFVLFSDEINPDGHPLLGRLGFMDQFSRIDFALRKSEFYLHGQT